MKYFNLLLSVFFIFSLCSCSGTWYLDLGYKQSNYIEKPKKGNLESALSQDTGKTILILDGDKSQYSTEGAGFSYGFVYETDFIFQRFNLSSIEYDTLSYTYSQNGSAPFTSPLTIKNSTTNYEAGFVIGYFVPKISMTRQTVETISITGNYSDSWVFLGYGAEIVIPIIEYTNIYVSYDKRFRITQDPLFKFSYTDISFGVMVNIFDLLFSGGSSGGGGGGSSERPWGNPFFQVL